MIAHYIFCFGEIKELFFVHFNCIEKNFWIIIQIENGKNKFKKMLERHDIEKESC